MENNISKQFENAIQLDHLTKDELELVANILKDFK
jgi:hypothetical protein